MIGLVVFAGMGWGCSCSEAAPACELFPSSSAVFVGKVVWGNDEKIGRSTRTTLYRVRVEEAFRGLGAEEREVLIDPGSYTSCYTQYVVGETYLFYAGSMGNVVATTLMGRGAGPAKALPAGMEKLKVYVAAMCSGSKEMVRAGEDLAWIRRAVRGETGTRVYGVAYQHRYGSWPDRGDVPLAGAKVVLAGAVRQEATSGPEGGYSFDGVAPGRYRLWAERAPWTGSYEWPIVVREGGCVARSLRLESHGVVAGMVQGGVSGVMVELVRVLADGTLEKGPSLWTETDRGGKFQLVNVPAGRFRLGVNVVSPMTARRPYLPSQLAKDLELTPTGEVRGLVVPLRAPGAMRMLRVRVFWADGREVTKGARAWAMPVEREERLSMGTDAKDGNVVTLRVMEAYSYRVVADWFSMAGGKFDNVRSAEVVLPPGKGDVVLDIRLEGVR
jgi:hypothetical protein